MGFTEIIKTIFGDWWRLYRYHFLEWNLYKGGIFCVGLLAAYVVGILLILPLFFFLITPEISTFLKDRIDTLTKADFMMLFGGIGLPFGVLILYVCFLFFLVGSVGLYQYMLIVRINLGYIRSENVAFWNRDFFSLRNLWRFTKVLFWMILLLLVGCLILSVGMMVGVGLRGGIASFSRLGLSALFIGICLLLGYFLYRVCFVGYIIADQKNFPDIGALRSIQTSWKISKKNSFLAYITLICMIVFFLILHLFFATFGKYLDLLKIPGAQSGINILYGLIFLGCIAAAFWTKKVSFVRKGVLLIMILVFIRGLLDVFPTDSNWEKLRLIVASLFISYDLLLTFLASMYTILLKHSLKKTFPIQKETLSSPVLPLSPSPQKRHH